MFYENQQIGNYHLIRRLGRGGFGEVWLAERRAKFVTTQVALKLPLDPQIDLQTIKRETSVWQQANGHPNILSIIDADEYDGQIVIVSEYAPNGSLNDWLQQHGKMNAEKAVKIFSQVLDGLEFLHIRRIIHRDLKPANILLRGETPLLGDFGISRVLQTTTASQSQYVAGTFAYMAPEALDGKHSFQTDIWSVGVSLYQLLSGRLPFPQKETSVLFGAIIMRDFDQLTANIPFQLQLIIRKALAKQPADRYTSARAMREDLIQIQDFSSSAGLLSPNCISEFYPLNDGTIETVVRKENKVDQRSKTDSERYENYVLPSSDLLTAPSDLGELKEDELLATAEEIVKKLSEFGVIGSVKHISPGPGITIYEFKPAPGIKYSRITNLTDDLSLTLRSSGVRIRIIPESECVGIEVPNRDRQPTVIREVLESKKFRTTKSKLSLALGKSIDGLNYIADLTVMPHLLIGGDIGSGKSMCLHSIITSILFKAKPDDVKFILVDPKQIEFGIYADIPHLATPVINNSSRASSALKWAVAQMEKRYRDLAGWGVRNADGYNLEVERRNNTEFYDDNGMPWQKLPSLVIVIDELGSFGLELTDEIKNSITRLAQMGHAAGVHLVVAPQRPSADVVIGDIKANFPARISFRVSSKNDSRMLIESRDNVERSLENGDMIFLSSPKAQPIRLHGSYISEKESAILVNYIKAQGIPDYEKETSGVEEALTDVDDLPGRRDPLFVDALRIVVANKSASTSLLQRHLRVGYGRSAAILDAMIQVGYIGEMDGSKRARPILQKAYEDLQEMGFFSR